MLANMSFLWQDFQSVVRTLLWEEVADDISDAVVGEITIEIELIRKLLDEP